ncbi:MAG: ABC transporter ATP-binding protein [Planctomycetota bacterium]|nr:ABC transporter ATP-binding protein [Planctomycetota bacterium]
MTSAGGGLNIRGLGHRFGDKMALQNIEWTLPSRGVVGLVGPNGAGKTTLFSIIAGFLRLQQGEVEILDAPRPGHSRLVGRVAVMPQDAIFAHDVSILDQLLFLRSLDGVTGQTARKEVFEAMQRVELADQLDRGAVILSHGMGKRLGVAQAILGSPELVLLDEPTAGLDPANARQVREIICQLGETALVVVSSHNLLELQEIIDQVAIIVEGKMVASGTVEEVTRRDRRFEIRLSKEPSVEQQEALRGCPAVRHLESSADRLAVDLDASGEGGIDQALTELLQMMLDQGFPPRELREGASLEEAYLRITGDSEANPE